MLVPFNLRTYRIGIANGIAAYTGSRLADINTIVPLLIHRLSHRAWIVGLVLGLRNIARILVEVASARTLDARDYKKRTYIFAAMGRGLSYVLVAVTLWFSEIIPTQIVLLAVILGVVGYAAALGPASLAFNDILAKSVPTTRRGSLQMFRKLGALVLIFAGVTPFVSWMIGPRSPLDFPHNYAALFGVAVIFYGTSWVLFAQVREPRSRSSKRKLTWNEHINRGVELFRNDSCYRRVLRIRLLIGIASMIRPFLIVFATEIWELPDEVAATFIAVQVAAEFIGSVIAGRISDHVGNRCAILLMIVSLIICSGAAVTAGSAMWDVPLTLVVWETNLQIIILGLAFIGSGFYLASLSIGFTNYLMDIAPDEKRPSYIGFSTAFTVPLSFAPLLFGWSADVFGYLPIFIAALVLSLGSLYLFLQLPEPRDDLDDEELEEFRQSPVAKEPADSSE